GWTGNVRGLWRLYRLLRARRPDVVQTWMYHADLIAGLVARLAGIRAVAWGIRNSGVSLGESSRSSRIAAWACARVSAVVPGVTAVRATAWAKEAVLPASRPGPARGYRPGCRGSSWPARARRPRSTGPGDTVPTVSWWCPTATTWTSGIRTRRVPPSCVPAGACPRARRCWAAWRAGTP